MRYGAWPWLRGMHLLYGARDPVGSWRARAHQFRRAVERRAPGRAATLDGRRRGGWPDVEEQPTLAGESDVGATGPRLIGRTIGPIAEPDVRTRAHVTGDDVHQAPDWRSPVAFSRPIAGDPSPRYANGPLKRAFDRMAGVVLSILTAPIFAPLAVGLTRVGSDPAERERLRRAGYPRAEVEFSPRQGADRLRDEVQSARS